MSACSALLCWVLTGFAGAPGGRLEPGSEVWSRVWSAPASEAAGEDRVLVWKDDDYALDALPRKFPEDAVETVASWAPFAVAQGFDMSVTDDGRVLILHHLPGTQAARQLRTIDKAARLFDDELPPPTPPPAGSAAAAPEETADLPEDPDGPPVDIDREEDAASVPWTTSWGAGVRPNGTGTIVLVEAANLEEYAAVLEHLLQLAPELQVWKRTAEANPGFTLEDPLCAAWVLDAGGAAEYAPRSELIHRLAELLVTQRFGWQPYWVLQGWAWHTEWSMTRGVWCFPYRTEPVVPAEHEAWKKEVRRLMQARTKPLGMADLAALGRSAWDGDAARYAWATFRVLTAKYPEALSEVLAEFNTTWDKDNRIDMGGGNWRRDPEYDLTPDQQLKALKRHTDKQVIATLTKAFLQF